ncbi:MAG: hypothetical protein ABFD91_17690, partial [Anaerohalosphaeraceae bacterium]
MKKILLLIGVFAVYSTAQAAIITSVVRTNGQASTSSTSSSNLLQTTPPSAFDGSTAPLATETGGLIVGNKVFSDRAVHNWSDIPLPLNQSEYVRTFNTDKAKTETDVTYAITISQAATVWFTMDDRVMTSTASGWGTSVPWLGAVPASMQVVADWIAVAAGPAGTFTDTGLNLSIYESSSTTARQMSVFSANLAAGTYTFGNLPHGS